MMSADPPGHGVWLTTPQVAARLGRKREHVTHLIYSGQLPAVRAGAKSYRVRVDVLAAYMAARRAT